MPIFGPCYVRRGDDELRRITYVVASSPQISMVGESGITAMDKAMAN